ncbi:MAG: hypothetical protein KJ015_09780 [Myxococcales bacterium]|nr:hypothetical protein [Myxococcales bacterium]
MRINGRILRPSDLEERRLMLNEFGTLSLRVPRGANPYLIARRLRRAAHNESPDLLFVRERLMGRRPKTSEPHPSPDIDVPEPVHRPVEAADEQRDDQAA